MENKSKKQNRVPRRGQFQAQIAELTPHGANHRSLILNLTGSAAKCFSHTIAGQFVQIACRDLNNPHECAPTLRRPFSIARLSSTWNNNPSQPAYIDPDSDQIYIEILYRIIGSGTQWLSDRHQGQILDILGPLGNGFTLPKDSSQRCILVGGGIGLPPLYCLADQLAASGITDILGIAGGRSIDQFEAILQNEIYQDHKPLEPQRAIHPFARSGTPCLIATDDGSCGIHGTVVQAMNPFLDQNSTWQDARIYCCGPEPMLKAVAQLAQQRQMECQVCMEAYMACGIGLCQSCAVAIKSNPTQTDNSNPRHYKLVCTNGPVFDAKTILWD